MTILVTRLCVGGPYAGKHFQSDIRAGFDVEVPASEGGIVSGYKGDPEAVVQVTVRREHYRAARISSGDCSIEVWLCDSLDRLGALIELAKAYEKVNNQ